MIAGPPAPWYARPIPWAAFRRFAARRPVGLLLGLGVLLRVAQFLGDRAIWMDEGSLLGNIRGKTFAGLFGPLASTQLAPPGFLAIEWVACRTLGDHAWSLRLAPLLSGIAALFLFERLARRLFDPPAALLALALFALADDLVYYASEIKQYSSDVAVGLACLLVGLDLDRGPATPRRFARASAIGAAGVWFSHPALFVLASVGLVAFARALARRDRPRIVGLALTGLAWLASFAAVYLVAMRQLDHRSDMWAFWAAAFPPRPTTPLAVLTWAGRNLLYLFVNPLQFPGPLGPTPTAVLVLGLYLLGARSLARRSPTTFAAVLLPVALTLLASGLRMYPFHGRLLLFLVPSLLVPIGEGASILLRPGRGRVVPAVVLALILVGPGLDAAYRLVVPRDRIDFNPYGDRRPIRLDVTHFPF